MPRVPLSARTDRHRAGVNRHTKDYTTSTFLTLRHTYDVMEAARDLLEATRSRSRRPTSVEDAQGGPGAADSDLGHPAPERAALSEAAG